MGTCTHLGTVDVNVAAVERGLRGLPTHEIRWVHLRLCMHCGHVGCCDSSPQPPRHRAHWRTHGDHR